MATPYFSLRAVMNDLFNVLKLGSNPDETSFHQMHESLKLAFHIINSSTDGIVICEAEPIDLPGPRIVYVNETFVKDTGYSAEEVIGKTPRILQGPKTDPAARLRMREAFKKWQPIREDVLNYRKNGEEFWLSLNIFPIANETGWYTHWIAIQHDITERKTRENELLSAKDELLIANNVLTVQNDAIKLSQLAQQESEERLSLAIRSTGVGIWDLNLQTNEMVWDESMFELYHMKREDFTNAVDAWENSLHPDDKLRAKQEANDAINNIKPFYTEFRIVWPDGKIRDIEAVAKVFFSDDGKPLRMLGSNIDITERKIVDKMKTELMATAAHELRTPMTMIHGYTELLKIGVGDTSEQNEMLDVIHTQSQSMIDLLNDMLDVARIEAQAVGVYQMELQPIGPRLKTLADTFITQDNHNKITLVLSPDLPLVKVDIAKLEQAIKNCLSNAYKFSPKWGEVTMRVTEVTHNKQRKVLIAIEDQGIGMTPEQLERVFEKFYRADPSGAIPGTGLGMAIIKSIIEQHGGSIEIQSEYGKGTKVMLYLPVA